MQTFPIWKNNKNFMTVANLLRKRGVPFYLVGGVVRHAVQKSKAPVEDFDLTTPMVPKKIKEKLRDIANIKILCQAEKFGTLKILYNENSYEITSFRTDKITDGRYAQVGFTESMKEDAYRRDFTCNALYAELDGKIYDPVGSGIDDLLSGRVRFVGSPRVRIKEDKLRVLRLFRFQAVLGKYSLPRSYRRVVQYFIPNLQNLSKERRWQEFLKLLKAPGAYKVLCVMHRWGVLRGVFPYFYAPYKMYQFFFKKFHQLFPLMVFVALGISESELPLTKKEKKIYKQYEKAKVLLIKYPSRKTLFKIAVSFSKNEACALLTLFYRKKLTKNKIRMLLKSAQNKKFPLTASILIQELSIKPSLQISFLLRKTEKEWLARLGQMDLKECIRYVEWLVENNMKRK